MNILTNDPSFTAWGWAIIDEANNVIDFDCIKTAPDYAKKRIRKSDDRVRRTEEIISRLYNLVDEFKVELIITELPHGSQNAQAAVMIGIVIGILTTVAYSRNIPFEYYSEADAKKAVLGKKAATKEDMIEAIDKLYDVDWTGIKYKDEAVADAIAIHYVATKESQLLKMMKR
jgi:Holliday junction resolvasome RuvABC endonuclease subunit